MDVNQSGRTRALRAPRPDPVETPTLTVEEAGKILGLARYAAYGAARRGEIPTIRLGHKLIVPTAKLLTMLGDLPQQGANDA